MAPSYQDSYSYGPPTDAGSYGSSENKQYYLPAARQPQLTATACQPGTKGPSVQPSGGYSQAQPLQPAATATAGQPANAPALSYTENYTYPLATSVLPTASVSPMPSYAPTSCSPASAPDTGKMRSFVPAGTGHASRNVLQTNPSPYVWFFSLLPRACLPEL
ncbi:zinc finger RNA-binding protein 2-like [Lontra canadensis]|uniref:zinc finger RNA-binding protein 2-like n=1 Tax=Lontra canadensis TaxID=76717 RepID=UPI0013F315BD|nr:zinc finger RNA-binding protein 2-like [Lontra canadensis]